DASIDANGALARANPHITIGGGCGRQCVIRKNDSFGGAAIKDSGKVFRCNPEPSIGAAGDCAYAQIVETGRRFHGGEVRSLLSPHATDLGCLPHAATAIAAGADPHSAVWIHMQTADDQGSQSLLATITRDRLAVEAAENISSGTSAASLARKPNRPVTSDRDMRDRFPRQTIYCGHDLQPLFFETRQPFVGSQPERTAHRRDRKHAVPRQTIGLAVCD